MSNIIVLITHLLSLWDRFDGIRRQYGEIIRKAREENRDITDEELDALRAKSKSMLDEWLNG